MHICVIVQSFPTKKTIDYIFVEQICRQFVENNYKVTVIAPQSITRALFRKVPVISYKSQIKWGKLFSYTLYRPFYISLGNRFSKLFPNSYNNAVLRTCNKLNIKPNLFYAHFWAQANSVFDYAKERKIPLFVVVGEESIQLQNKISSDRKYNLGEYVKGIICVSTKSQEESISAGFLLDIRKSIVIPNAIDQKLFYRQDRMIMRRKLGFSADDFIVIFVGQFNNRKGVLRLCEALELLDDDKIKAVFIGRGTEIPTYRNTLLSKTIMHDELANYLCASDIFVLPTLNEGCCNAIIEALACGLPVVSSNLSFNWDILNDSNSVLVDPNNIEEISCAIKRLKDDKIFRERLSSGAEKTASKLTIQQRAKRILNFINSKI